jgi:hypothetical protein
MTTIELKSRHQLLKKLDGGGMFRSPSYKVFGASTHRYKFNPRLTEHEVSDFERIHRIKLPSDYRRFLLEIGNGGSGPAYGLFPLADWNFELDISDPSYLSTEFPHTDKWNMSQDFSTDNDDYYETEAFLNWEQEYFSTKNTTGSIRICHYGCAIYYLLVISGPEAELVWVDDRANDQGIYPAISKLTGKRLMFTDWYDEWLTESMEQIKVTANER